MNMNTIEGNKLIAEFMNLGYMFMKTADHPEGSYYSAAKGHEGWESLQYHSSWDWLMPVWVKISELAATEKGVGITILKINFQAIEKMFTATFNYRTKYNNINSEHEYQSNIDKDPIKACWQTIIQFIQWYNQQKQ